MGADYTRSVDQGKDFCFYHKNSKGFMQRDDIIRPEKVCAVNKQTDWSRVRLNGRLQARGLGPVIRLS